MVAIRNMEMPSCCGDCPMFGEDFVSIFCSVTKKPLWYIDTNKERHKKCPLIEVKDDSD